MEDLRGLLSHRGLRDGFCSFCSRRFWGRRGRCCRRVPCSLVLLPSAGCMEVVSDVVFEPVRGLQF